MLANPTTPAHRSLLAFPDAPTTPQGHVQQTHLTCGLALDPGSTRSDDPQTEGPSIAVLLASHGFQGGSTHALATRIAPRKTIRLRPSPAFRSPADGLDAIQAARKWSELMAAASLRGRAPAGPLVRPIHRTIFFRDGWKWPARCSNRRATQMPLARWARLNPPQRGNEARRICLLFAARKTAWWSIPKTCSETNALVRLILT